MNPLRAFYLHERTAFTAMAFCLAGMSVAALHTDLEDRHTRQAEPKPVVLFHIKENDPTCPDKADWGCVLGEAYAAGWRPGDKLPQKPAMTLDDAFAIARGAR